MVRIQERSSIERETQKIYSEPNTLKRQIVKDSENELIFFDENAFAKWRDIDGVRILTVLTTAKYSAPLRDSNDYSDALSFKTKYLYCKAKDIKRKPLIDTVIRVDGLAYRIVEASPALNGQAWKIEIASSE